MQRAVDEIIDLTMDATTRVGETLIPGLLMIKGEVPVHQLAALYDPMIGLVVQGYKTLSIGNRSIDVKALSYFVVPTHIPATATVGPGPDGRPYLSVGLALNHEAVRQLMGDVSETPEPRLEAGIRACEADEAFLDAWLRMLRLTKTPDDIAALAPAYEREILYRVLKGPIGNHLRQLAIRESNLCRISQAVAWLRSNYREPVDVAPMAKAVAMAVTTFHRQFKRITGLSPIQFQKQLRLFEARKLLAFSGYGVAEAAYEVGYQSASQFNREYARQFGAPPRRDALELRQAERSRVS